MRRDRFTQEEVMVSRAVSSVRVSVELGVHVVRRAGVLERFATPETIGVAEHAVPVTMAISRIDYCDDAPVLGFRLRAQLGGIIKAM